MKKKKIFWFIFTNDSFTNEVISRELPPEDIIDGVKCFDGVKRKLWKCDGKFVTKIKKNKKSHDLHFKIFKQEGKYGSIKKCDFFGKKRKNVDFITSYYTQGQTKDIYEILKVKKGECINTMPSMNDYKPRVFHR